MKKDEKFASLVPSVQAAICLLYSANTSASADMVLYAEDAIMNTLRCDPQILYPYMNTVHILINNIKRCYEKRDLSPSKLIAPPTSESPRTPSVTPPNAEVIPTVNTPHPIVHSQHPCIESNQVIDDDSGFISGFSSPAIFLGTTNITTTASSSKSGDQNVDGSAKKPSVCSRRRSKRSASLARLRRSYEFLDNGVIAYYHPNEEDFLSSC
ncbi:unnamed protein product [Thelazia callipaeda]|uniref:Cyclin_C domain-containing protein n=1 Tax=Thelazia callipaeda TaxID=103827 RepID=A0A0N5CN23_THECL|nr:unnamed protein product [Thelazia callipaeda]